MAFVGGWGLITDEDRDKVLFFFHYIPNLVGELHKWLAHVVHLHRLTWPRENSSLFKHRDLSFKDKGL
jgi:hypothetical protein